MLNIRYKGKYKDEKQLKEDSTLYKNAIMFEEEATVTEAFKKGTLLSLPIFLVMLVLAIVMIRINHIKFSYDILHLAISSMLLLPLLYVHEIIHALTFPIKEKKDIYSKPQEMALFVYSNALVSKKRFILICLMPALILGILPYTIGIVFINIIPSKFLIDILYISIAMFMGGIGDFTNVYNTLKQVPKNAKVFNYGYHSYWIKK